MRRGCNYWTCIENSGGVMVNIVAARPQNGVSSPMRPDIYTVLQRRRETADTFSLDLARADGSNIPAFEPGQFNMLYIFGVGEVPISISSDPANHASLVHTTRAVGTVTRAMSLLK